MATPAERFLNILARPFSDNAELQIHVRRAMEERMTSTTTDPEAWDAPAAALDAGNQHPWRRRWRWGLWLTVLLVSLACLLPMAREIYFYKRLGADPFNAIRIYGGYFNEDYLQQQLPESLSPEQRLILCGETARGAAGRWEALWKKFPDRPAYYAQYAHAYASERSDLPKDFLATAERIDPDNAWFPMFAAAVKSTGVVKSRKQSRAQSDAHVPREWDVSDEPRLAECLELLHRAATLPRFDAYATELAGEKLAVLPPATDTAERLRNLNFASHGSGGMLSLPALSRAVAAKAWLLANQGDKEAFQHLMVDWTRLMRQQAGSDDRTLAGLIALANLTATLPNLADGAERLGLSAEASRLQEANRMAWAVSDSRRTRAAVATDKMIEAAVANHGSMILGQMLPVWARLVKNAPVPTDAELKPGRMIDHTIFHRILCASVFPVVFFIAGVAALYRFRSGRLARRLSGRLVEAIALEDWTWIFAAALLPSVYFAGLHGLTPLGGRDWGLANPGMVSQAVQLTAWLLMTMAAPVAAARWRLQCRFPGASIANRGPLVLGIVVILGGIASAIAGIYYLHPHEEDLVEMKFFDEIYRLPPGMEWPVIAAVILLPLLWWWLSSLMRAVFTRHDHALGRQTVARLLIPAWIFLLLPVVVLIPICKARERYWVPRDILLQPTPTFTRYEGEIASRMKEQNLGILRVLEPDR
ncbi:hypothetical protein KBB96_19860 [Luteolibacter ambystomatis]|uniref:Uncharacterized protein n=1 Tax=Luteolibacter ambystomatis TaxID=2824561 RepID=A0A975G955_9BACT|nr:hypothetical protein [Luteolibacter ambystomatis]QUE51098.1 hypothetical protein KBB96_19860 [Luteolibacter ambystomatis]